MATQRSATPRWRPRTSRTGWSPPARWAMARWAMAWPARQRAEADGLSRRKIMKTRFNRVARRSPLVLAALAALCAVTGAHAEISDGVVKIGLLTDMSGAFSQFSGQGSVVAAQMAIDDCLAKECKGM